MRNKVINNRTAQRQTKINAPSTGNSLQRLSFTKQRWRLKGKKYFYGLIEGTFNTRNTNHMFSFRHREHSTHMDLPQYIWTLNDKNKGYTLKWGIEAQTSSCRNRSSRRNLCLMEKLKISQYKNAETLLNKRAEIVSKCRHCNKSKSFIFYPL